jgi:signal peptidase I
MSSETDAPSQTEEPLTTWQKVVRELKEWAATLAIVAPAFLLFTGLFYEQRVIPSESMVPTLEVGDRVAVAKFAYGYGRYSLPLSLGRYLPLGHGRFFPSLPERGDVVVFEHTHSDRVMIKRVIGLPGDTVQMLNETLIINGEPVESEYVRSVRYVPDKEVVIDQAEEWRETIGDKSWITHRGLRGRPVSDSLLFIVPEGHLFMVGDNRNNSYDSRELSGHCPPVNGVVDRAGCPLRGDPNDASVGFVPLDHLIGRADTVLLTFHRCKLQDDVPCRKRVWQPL